MSFAVSEALDFLGHDFRGQHVWVKPNLLGPHPPEMGVTTDPELVRQLVRQLKAGGAKQITVGDNPGGSLHDNAEQFIARTGIVEASEGCFRNVSRATATLPLESRFVESVPVSPVLFEADVVLNLPVFKTHALTILTGAVKNMFGVVVGGHKTMLHTLAATIEGFSELLVDIYQAIPRPMLHIMDALRGMDGPMGPSSGRVLKIGKLLAGRNGVALDAVMALMAGVAPDLIPVTRIGAERNLGPIDPQQIEIAGDFERIAGFRTPSLRLASGIGRISAHVYPWLRRRPVLNRSRCTRCQECFKSCPVQAISMNPWPLIDRRKCISCFCCAEICPERALRIPGTGQAILRNLLGQ